MKRCPECRRDYNDETLRFCLDDGTPLVDGPATDGRSDEPLTARMEIPAPPSHRGSEDLTRSLDSQLIANELRSHKARWGMIAIAAIVLLTGFGFGIYKLFDLPKTSPPRSSANITTQRLSGDGRTRQPVISPDGKFMVYVKLEGGQQSLWIKQIQTGSNVNVVKPGESDEFWGITFSPDGNYVYYNAGGRFSKESPTIYRVSAFGGTPTKFLSNAFLLRISPDGKQVSFRRGDLATLRDSVIVANIDGSGERELNFRLGTQYFNTPAAWSPDGKYVAVAIGDDALAPNPNMVPALISIVDGKVTQLDDKKWEELDDIIWHPSGDSLLVVAQDNASLPAQVWEISYPTIEYRKLTNDINGHYSVSVTNDGSSIVTGELYARSSIWVSPDLKPENAKQIMPATGDTWGIAWTPDGRIVYSSDQSGDIQIWIMNADGTDARPLTSDKTIKMIPTVSRDGRYIVYSSTSNGGELVRIDINGGNPRVLTKNNGADNAHISPDGKWVIYSAYVDGIIRVLRVAIDGGDGQVLTADAFATEPRYSNDGTRFACFLLDPRALVWNKIAIYPAEGGQPIRTLDVPGDTNSGRGPVWAPDDENIIVVVAPGEKQNLWSIPVDGGPGKQMTDFDVPGIARREYSPDGKRIAIVRAEGFGNAIMLTGFR